VYRDRCRLSAPEGEIGVQTVGAGRYACTDFTGLPTEIHTAWTRLCEWLPDSGWQAADGAPVEIYGKDFAMDEKTGGSRARCACRCGRCRASAFQRCGMSLTE
jgi:DNA gyrase inhibitor GyrI